METRMYHVRERLNMKNWTELKQKQKRNGNEGKMLKRKGHRQIAKTRYAAVR
jgi:hypothetical protein